MSSIESKIALFQQATATMWQNTISSDFIKGLVDAGTAIVELTDKVGLGTVAFESFIAIMMVLNKSNWTAWSSDIMNAVNVLGNAGRYRESEQALSTYVKVLGQLDTAQQKAVLSKLGYSKATRDAIMADVAAANAEKVVTAEKLKGALADKLGNEEKAKLVIKELEAAGAIQLENGALKAVNKEKLISILETKDMTAEEAKEFVTALGLTGANTGLAASFKLLTVSIGTAAKELALFLLTNPIGWIVDALILIPLLIKGIDKVIVTYDEQIDKLKELQEEYKNIKSELESVNGEIESATERIKELTSIDTSKLSIVEQKELDDLREEVRLLQIRKSILESQEKESKSKANKAAQKAAKKTVKSEFVYDMNYAMMGITNYGQVNRVTPQEELELSLKTYRKYSEEIAKIDEQLANGSIKQSKYDSLKKTYEDKQLKALSRANKMSESIATMREGLDEADASNANLIQSTDKVLDEYGLFSDEINKTTTYFNSLEEAKRKQVIIDKMVADGVKGDINGFVKDLNDEDLCVLYTMNMNEETSIEDLKQGIANMQKEADGQPITVTTVAGKASDVKNYISTQKATVAGSNSEQTLDAIFNNYESEINKLSDYLAKAVNNGLSNSDYVALSTDFGIVASSAKEAEEAIREVMDASESSTIGVLDEAIKNASETGREDLVPALEGIKDRLAEVNDEAQKLSDGNSGFAKAMSSMAGGFDALDKIYVDVKNGKDKNKSSENNGAYFDFSSLVDSNFVEQFQECGDAYQNFLDVVMRTPDDINACQSAFDDLATKYVLQRAGIEDLVDAQGNINEAMKQTTITQLKNWGITNAKALVDNECAAAALYHKSAIDELNVSSDASVGVLANEVSALLNESDTSGVTKTALFDLISAQKIFNNTSLDTSGKIKALQDLAMAFGLTAEEAQNAASEVSMNKAITEAQKKSIAVNHRELTDSEKNAIKNQYLSEAKNSTSDAIAAKFGKLTGKYGGGQSSNKVGSSGGSSGGSGGTTTTIDKNYINWAENSIDNLTNKIERLQSLITDTTSYSKKIKYLKEIYSYQKKLVNIESKNVTATKKQYNKMLNNLSGSQKKKYKKLIESTTAVSYEQFVSTTTGGGKKKGNKTVNKETKTLYEAVSNAQSAWKEYQDALGSYKEKNAQLVQHQIDIYEAELDYMDQKISVYEERIERAQSRIDDIDPEKVLKDVKKGNKLFSNKKPSSKTVKKYAEEYGMSADRYTKLFKNKNNTDEYKAGVLQGAYNAKQYKIEASNYRNIIDLQNSKADKLIKERKLVGTTTEKYKELSEEIAKAQAEAMKASEELEEQLYNIANAEFSAIQNAYKTTSERTSGRADAIQSRIDYKINNGGEVSKTDYEKVISLRKDDENKALQERLDLERKLTETRNKLKKLNKSDKNYEQNLAALTRAEKDQTLAVYESVSAYYQKKEATRAAQLQMIKAPLVNLERELKLIQAQIAELEKLRQKCTDSIGVVNYYLGEQIENLNKQKDNINAYYDSIIDPLQKQLDLLSKVNEQRDRALALEKAQYELEKAKSQKTQKVLRNGSWQWEADQESVRDAQKNLDDAKFNKVTGELKDTIDDLNRAKEEQLAAYDKEIDRITVIQNQWSQMIERAEYMSKLDAFEATYGSLEKILNGDTTAFDNITQDLQDLQLNLDNLNLDSEHIQNQITNINDIVSAFENGKLTFEDANKYLGNASDSLEKLESTAAQKVPTIIEITDELSTSISEIVDSCRDLATDYDKAMSQISSSTKGTSGTAGDLRDMANSLDSVRIQLDEINPVTGATAEQFSSIKDSIYETGKSLSSLTDNYLEDANNLFKRLSESVYKSYTKFEEIGKYISATLIPKVSTLCGDLQILSNRYRDNTTDVKNARSATVDYNNACISVISTSSSLIDTNKLTAESYREMASAANSAASAARAAAAAAEKQAEAAAKASSASSSSSSSSVISKVVSSVGSLFSKVLSGSSHSEGTKNAKAGTSLVGETAPELVWHKEKKSYQLVSEPSLVDLDAGDVVFNGNETREIMKNGVNPTGGELKGFQSKILKSSYSGTTSNIPSSTSTNNETTIHVDKVELPNIRSGEDAQKLVDALCNLDGTVTQKLHSK